MRHPYPFAAIVGQEEMKTALLIASVDPHVGGVLVFGERGTGKSTAVRALAALLPAIWTTEGCAYGCDPEGNGTRCDECIERSRDGKRPRRQRRTVRVVDLPLGATEDRVVGTLDIERALSHGERHFEPGLLARAHRGFLYIDEVNLLEDHLVDVLLDVAASGENVVEREGLSVRHPARFVLVGSGNPEEGELRPQLLDRFGLAVEVKTPTDVEERLEILRRRDDFDRNPEEFVERWRSAEAALRRRIVRARRLLPLVVVRDRTLRMGAAVSTRLGTDGIRADLTLLRAARAVAALDGADEVDESHVRAVLLPALRHRLRRDPLDETGSDARVQRAVDEVFGAAR